MGFGMSGPAGRLQGQILDGGWHVDERVERPISSSGGNFSVGYRVSNEDGAAGFLKAFDFSRAFDGPRFSTLLLEKMAAAYNYELDVLRRCEGANMSRVVRILANGSVAIEGSDLPVMYLIFELADGDVRRHLMLSSEFDRASRLRCLHDVAVGLSQLHSRGIGHQDIKPSNVLMFG